MLETLRIKNFAIIDEAEIRFKPGLNILSGETGAGKSIIIEAISLILGSRASADLVRSGSDEAQIEGFFDVSDLPWLSGRLSRLGLSIARSELLIKRVVHRSGKNRIHINGDLATSAILHELCEGLVDLCGQNEHQSLLKSQTQLELLDTYGGLSEQAKKISTNLAALREKTREMESLEAREAERSRKIDFLKFQIAEIREAGLASGEDEGLQREKQLLQSVDTRAQAAEAVRTALQGEDEGALNLLRTALQKLRSLAALDDHASALREGLERAIAEAEEVALGLDRYLATIDLNPARLEEVQSRLSLIADLRRKYGGDVDAILRSLAALEIELDTLSQTGTRLDSIRSEIGSLSTDLGAQGQKLSQSRSKAGDLFSRSVTAELKDLKMPDASLAIDLVSARDELSKWNAAGPDAIQFLIQTNRGEPARPLSKIASGGELSRLMLAIRRVIADRGGIGVYLFDEIDAGIGGQTAFVVGRKLKSVSQYNQVICITHLPQIASFADHHIVVRKSTQGDRTQTEVVELGVAARKEELARMLGGPKLTKSSLENAAELLESAAN